MLYPRQLVNGWWCLCRAVTAPRSSHASRWTVQRRAGASLDLHKTLDQVVAAVVELLDFDVAVMNLVSADGDREVLSVAGPAEVREHLLGTTQSQCTWQQMLDAARPTGNLRFVHHDDADLLDEPARLAGARITNRKPHPRSRWIRADTYV